MSVAGVRIEGDVGEEHQLGHCRLDRPHGAQHQALGVQCLAAVRSLEFAGCDRKERDAANA